MSNLAFFPIAAAFLGFAATLLISKIWLQKLASIIFALAYTSFGFLSIAYGSKYLPVTLYAGGWEHPFGISIVYDSLSALLVTVTGLIYLAAVLYAKPGNNAEKSPLFFPLIHILICGISGAFTTGDLFNLYVWFEVILLSSFVLLTLSREKLRLAGAFKYVILNIISSLIFLAAAGLIYNTAHTLNFSQLAVNLKEVSLHNPSYVAALSSLIFVAFAT